MPSEKCTDGNSNSCNVRTKSKKLRMRNLEKNSLQNKVSESLNLEEVISKLEAPAFSPLDRAFPEPIHQNKKLRWDHKVNLIGEKVMNPMIHCCEQCALPILNYGRMIPCKHVFCYDCAKKCDKQCPKCDDKVRRVEPSGLATIFMCTFGSQRYGPVTCGRTYLSQRDLQAHINHRHLKPPPTAVITTTSSTEVLTTHSTVTSSVVTMGSSHHPISRDPRDPRGHGVSLAAQTPMVSHTQHSHSHSEHRDPDHSRSPAIGSMSSPAGQSRQYPHSPVNFPSTIPVSSARPNLITVPIQDDSTSTTTSQHPHAQPLPPQYTPPPSNTASHALPPMQHPQTSYPPPPHAYQHPLPAPAYSQALPITTQTFTQHPPPSVHHPPPPIRAPAGPLYSTPPPHVHHLPPATYSNPPQAAPPPAHGLPPQRFPPAANYEENAYMQPWTSGAVPPPARANIPPPRPITAPPPSAGHNLGHIPPRAPADPGYRQPYYQ